MTGIKATRQNIYSKGTHEFKLCLATERDAYGLNALFVRFLVIESKESLMRLNTRTGSLVDYLK